MNGANWQIAEFDLDTVPSVKQGQGIGRGFWDWMLVVVAIEDSLWVWS